MQAQNLNNASWLHTAGFWFLLSYLYLCLSGKGREQCSSSAPAVQGGCGFWGLSAGSCPAGVPAMLGQGLRMRRSPELPSHPERVTEGAEVLRACLLGFLGSVFTEVLTHRKIIFFPRCLLSMPPCYLVLAQENIYPMKVLNVILKMANMYFISSIWESVLPLAICQNMGVVIKVPPELLIETRDVAAI